MADRLRTRLLVAACLTLGGGAASAQGLPDPTRPTPGYGADSSRTVVPGVGAPDVTATLQSVVLPRKGKPKAVIGGELYALGDKVGERKLIAVNEQQVTLEGPQGREVLRLTPAAEKKIIKRTPSRRQRE